MVDKREKLMNSFNQYGFLTFKQVIDENLHYKTLLKMLAEGKIDAEEKGLYRLPDIYLDEWFVLQYRFPKGIFSLETALWLHSLSLTIPFNMTMSFPYGTNTKNIKEADICPIILRSHYSEGIIEIERLPGRFIKVYEVEEIREELMAMIGKYKGIKTYIFHFLLNLPKKLRRILYGLIVLLLSSHRTMYLYPKYLKLKKRIRQTKSIV